MNTQAADPMVRRFLYTVVWAVELIFRTLGFRRLQYQSAADTIFRRVTVFFNTHRAGQGQIACDRQSQK